jgi:hypothetical protein
VDAGRDGQSSTPVLRALFHHLLSTDMEVAQDRIDVVLHLLEAWTDLRPSDSAEDAGGTAARRWSQDHVGRGFGTAGVRVLGEMEEVPYDGRVDGIPPDLLDQLAWEVLVTPLPEAFGRIIRAVYAVTFECREWTSEVANLAGHLLLAHDIDARTRRLPGDDHFDLLERLWAEHLPWADLEICLGEVVERELTSD